MTDLYAPFFEATRSVFQMMLDLSDITDRPAEAFSCENAVDVSIGVIGDLSGDVIYRFSRRASLNMVQIMCGMEIDTLDDFVVSAVSEIANIISGNVLTLLADSDLRCDILPPKPGECSDEPGAEGGTACCICTSAGDVCLDIRLSETQ